MSYRGHVPEGSVYYQDPRCVAVLFDPDGGHHPCQQLGEHYGNRFWAAGWTGVSPEEIVNRIHQHWNDPDFEYEGNYARLEASFGEFYAE